ncbi:tail spike protein [Serratia phage Eta]|uniref:Putative tailspike protein n=1 Tax=Serratia phage Eta TaxID=1282995 RepID=R9VYM3_9CAUD|nr:tail spike protein [Serratia phage Eta]AGN89515.1 putative tailspike protein [Serratia phage Eta]
MSSGCGDVLSLEDLKTAKKHQLFEAEVITGRSGGVATGAFIDIATNQATGQVQKTMPAVLRDIGFAPASFDFNTGGTISDRNVAVLWPLPGGDGDWYVWEGALPKIIPAASTPDSTGGVAAGAWKAVNSNALRDQLSVVSPEMFGAIGNGIADDTIAWQAMDSYVSARATASHIITIIASRKYRVTAQLNGWSYVNLLGGGTLIYDGADQLNSTVLTYNSKTKFNISNINITRNFNDPFALRSKGAYGLTLASCSDFSVVGCDIYMHTDALSVMDSDRFKIESNRTHELGEEGIAVRRSRNWSVINNDVYHHNGDGILIKTGNVSSYAGSICDNRVYDGIQSAGTAGGNRGGGITGNDEVIGGGATESFNRLIVERNHCYNVSYGIAFTNIVDLSMSNNMVNNIDRFGIIIDTALFNNPNKNPVKRISVSNNHVSGTVQAGLLFTGTADISVSQVTISNNIVDTCGTSTAAGYPAIGASFASVTGNKVTNCKIGLQVEGCATTGNVITDSTYTSSAPASVWVKIIGGGSFNGNSLSDSKFGHIRFSSISGLTFTGNTITTASSFACLYFDSVSSGSTCIFRANNYVSAFTNVSVFNIGAVPAVPALVGDELIVSSPPAGGIRRLVCVTAGNPGVYVPVEWNIISAVSSSSSPTINAGASLRITGTAAGVASNSACVGAKFNQDPQGVDMVASVTGAGTVTFILTNNTGSSKTFSNLVMTAYCHS